MSTNNGNTAEQTKQYDDNMRGVLYKNNQKTDAKHPGARGRAMVEGVWFWISSWTQHTKTTGEKYQSLAFTKMTDEEVQKYITSQNSNSAPASKPAQTNAQTQTSNQPAQQAQQKPQEHNADGSARPSNEPPMDFDDEIPF